MHHPTTKIQTARHMRSAGFRLGCGAELPCVVYCWLHGSLTLCYPGCTPCHEPSCSHEPSHRQNAGRATCSDGAQYMNLMDEWMLGSLLLHRLQHASRLLTRQDMAHETRRAAVAVGTERAHARSRRRSLNNIVDEKELMQAARRPPCNGGDGGAGGGGGGYTTSCGCVCSLRRKSCLPCWWIKGKSVQRSVIAVIWHTLQ